MPTSIKLTVQSSSFANPNPAIIKIDGNIINTTGRGLQIAILDGFTGSMKRFQIFDTHGNTTNSGNMVKFLNNYVIANDIIIVAVDDEATDKLTLSAKSKLQSLGSTCIHNLGYRNTWILVTRGNGQLIKELKGNEGGYITLTDEIYIYACH